MAYKEIKIPKEGIKAFKDAWADANKLGGSKKKTPAKTPAKGKK